VQPDQHRNRSALLCLERLRRKWTTDRWIWNEFGLSNVKGSARFNRVEIVRQAVREWPLLDVGMGQSPGLAAPGCRTSGKLPSSILIPFPNRQLHKHDPARARHTRESCHDFLIIQVSRRTRCTRPICHAGLPHLCQR
jgi:hypothetical protein